MPDAPAQSLVEGAVRLDLVPLAAGQEPSGGRVLVVVLTLQLHLRVSHVGEWDANLTERVGKRWEGKIVTVF